MQINWKPSFGDPTVVGWVTLVAYFFAFFLSLRCAVRTDRYRPDKEGLSQRSLWWMVSIGLLLLGINKQLDILTWLTDTGRLMALREGWYHQRRIFQAWFISGVAFTGVSVLVIMSRKLKHAWRENRLTIVGMVFLVTFIVIRAVSYHYIDAFLGFDLDGFKPNWILELGGITCILISAVMHLKRISRGSRRISQRNDIFI